MLVAGSTGPGCVRCRVALLRVHRNYDENARYYLLADSSCGGESVLVNLPANCDLMNRMVLNLRLDAAGRRTHRTDRDVVV